MIETFSRRMWNAVAFIESGREHSRQLDDAFENDDGRAMAAALYTLSATRPKLAKNIAKYVTPPEQFPDAKSLTGKSIVEIRRAAKQMREEAQATYAERVKKYPAVV